MAVKNYLINDKWLDIDKQNIVEVKSTDGVIGSVKLNGEEYGGGGSSDFSTAQVTLAIGSLSSSLGIQGVCMLERKGSEYLDFRYPVEPNTTSVITAVLYKGVGSVWIETSDPVTVEGNIQQMTSNAYMITGDCTITIS